MNNNILEEEFEKIIINLADGSSYIGAVIESRKLGKLLPEDINNKYFSRHADDDWDNIIQIRDTPVICNRHSIIITDKPLPLEVDEYDYKVTNQNGEKEVTHFKENTLYFYNPNILSFDDTEDVKYNSIDRYEGEITLKELQELNNK